MGIDFGDLQTVLMERKTQNTGSESFHKKVENEMPKWLEEASKQSQIEEDREQEGLDEAKLISLRKLRSDNYPVHDLYLQCLDKEREQFFAICFFQTKTQCDEVVGSQRKTDVLKTIVDSLMAVGRIVGADYDLKIEYDSDENVREKWGSYGNRLR